MVGTRSGAKTRDTEARGGCGGPTSHKTKTRMNVKSTRSTSHGRKALNHVPKQIAEALPDLKRGDTLVVKPRVPNAKLTHGQVKELPCPEGVINMGCI